MQLTPHIELLTSFAQEHLIGSSDDQALIQLKLTHSLHVLENAEHIIEGEDISGKTATLCRLAALYHDIGRFPQYLKYRTFKDQDSVNHGRLGVLTLRSLELPDDLPDSDWRIIRFAVAQHNIISTRETLPNRLAVPTHIVRDADKTDIFRVMVEHFGSGEPLNKIMTHGIIDAPDTYSDVIYKGVMAERGSDYRLMRYANDFKLVIIGWLFDLHYSSSIRLIAERKYMEQIFSMLPKDTKIQRLEEKVFSFMRYNNCQPS